MKPFLNPNQNLLDKTKSYLVAVSFGPDSMALLHRLHTAGYSLRVAHINYHLRPESNLEQTSLEQYCFLHDLPLDVLDVKTFPKGNRQLIARNLRYDFFHELVKNYKLAAVLTAHHQDDDLETALMQSNRGGHYVYYGIRERSTWLDMLVIRPMLELSKAALVAYCDQHKVPYAIDASNAKPIYQRNRLRNKLATLSNEEKRKQLKAFKVQNTKLFQQSQTLASFAKKRSLFIAQYLSWDDTKQFLYWYHVFAHHHIHETISQSFLLKIKIILQSQKPNHEIKLSKNHPLFIAKAYDRFYLLEPTMLKPYRFQSPTLTITLPLLILHPQRLHHLPPTFILRSVKPHDMVTIKDYQKPFRRLAIDWKMPKFLRTIWPVITDGKGKIFYLPRFQKNPTFQANNWLEILE